MTNVKPLRLAKRTTLTSYSNEGKVNVNIPPGRDGVPSAPFQTAGKLGVKVPNGDTPISAGIGMGQGRKSFLRPFLLGGRKKKGEMPAAAMHKSRKEEEFNVPKSQDGFQGVGDDHLQVDLESPESPYEDTASPSKDEVGGVGEASPVGAPLVKGKKGVTKRVAAMRIDEVAPSSPGIVTPKTPNITLAPITPATPVSPLNVPSPVPTPTTAFIQLSPIEAQVPISPIPITPITPSQAIKTPPSPIGSIPNTPIPTTHVIPAGTISSHRESERKLESGRDRHHRNREETNDERRTRKEREREREHSKRERGSGERKPRSSRSDVEKEDTWLEVVFEDLPFGPDKNMVSASFFPFFPFSSFSTPSPCPFLDRTSTFPESEYTKLIPSPELWNQSREITKSSSLRSSPLEVWHM